MTSAAVFDIGTNTVRSLAQRDGVEYQRSHRVVRLGQGVDGSGRFAPEAVDRAVAGLAELAAEVGPTDLRDAVATSATRDAANRDEFLDRAEAVLGVRPRMISGDDEAALSFAGARSGWQGSEPIVVIDVGGGSTEFVFGTDAPSYGISVDVGSVRLTERIIPERPATPDRVEEALDAALALMGDVALPGTADRAIGVAGTFTALAAIDLGLEVYDRDRVHHHDVAIGRLERIVGSLSRLTVEETERIPSLEPARAPMLLGGAIVTLAALRTVGADSVMVSEHDLLDGLMARLLASGA